MTGELHSIMSWRSIADNFSTIIELIYDMELTIIELTTMKCERSRLIILSVHNNREEKFMAIYYPSNILSCGLVNNSMIYGIESSSV